MNKAAKIITSLLLSALFFVVLLMLTSGSAYSGVSMLLGSTGFEALINTVFLGLLLLLSVVVFINLYQLMTNRVFVPLIKAETILYFVLFFAIIMLKSRGIQDINLNVLDIFEQAVEFPVSIVLNIVLFIPLGMVFFKYFKSYSKAFPLAFIAILIMEALQYFLHLGIADVVDVVVNMIGFSIGYLSLDILKEGGVRVVPEGNNYAKISFPQKNSADQSTPFTINKGLLRRKAIVTASSTLACMLLFAVGFSLYDYEEYVPEEYMAEITTDKTLNSLPTQSLTFEEAQVLADSMHLFRISNSESSSNWIKINEFGTFQSRGEVSQCDSWLADDGTQYYGLSMAINEELRGIMVTHGIPLIVTPQTEITFSGDKVERAAFEEVLLDLDFYSIDAEYSLQDGWFKAEKISLLPGEFGNTGYSIGFNYGGLTEETNQKIAFTGEYWFEAHDNESSLVEGYIDSTWTDADSNSYFTVRIPDKIGTALICHSLTFQCDTGVSENLMDSIGPVKVEAILQNEKLTFLQ